MNLRGWSPKKSKAPPWPLWAFADGCVMGEGRERVAEWKNMLRRLTKFQLESGGVIYESCKARHITRKEMCSTVVNHFLQISQIRN